MIRLSALIAFAGLTLLLSGCASTPKAEDPNSVSTIPWNAPEKWEGQGALGGMGEMINSH
jgi:hypothetical protein